VPWLSADDLQRAIGFDTADQRSTALQAEFWVVLVELVEVPAVLEQQAPAGPRQSRTVLQLSRRTDNLKGFPATG